jgi:putative transposase
VSRAAQRLDEELRASRNQPLGRIPCLILDARDEKVRHGGSVVDCAVLTPSASLPLEHAPWWA